MVVTRRTLPIALALAPLLLLARAPARAEGPEPADAEEMRREIRSLKAQVQSLRAAVTEAAEFDRMRANALARALGASPTASELAPPKGPDATSGRRPAVSKSVAVSPAAASARRAPPVEPAAGGWLRGRVEVPAGEPVAYVYVENLRGPLVREKKVIKQVDKQFVPRWAVVQHGTAVEFPNLDNIYHNVFSLSSGNSFDLGLYNGGTDGKAHTFEEPGAVDVYCNIHPQMAASLLVVPNRYYAKVKQDGTFEIAGVPVGRRKVVAWAPGSRLVADWVEVQPGAPASISLKLERKTGGHTNKQGRPYGSYE
jgi:plastocyanin